MISLCLKINKLSMKIKNKTKFNKAIKQTVKLFLNQKNGKFY